MALPFLLFPASGTSLLACFSWQFHVSWDFFWLCSHFLLWPPTFDVVFVIWATKIKPHVSTIQFGQYIGTCFIITCMLITVTMVSYDPRRKFCLRAAPSLHSSRWPSICKGFNFSLNIIHFAAMHQDDFWLGNVNLYFCDRHDTALAAWKKRSSVFLRNRARFTDSNQAQLHLSYIPCFEERETVTRLFIVIQSLKCASGQSN